MNAAQTVNSLPLRMLLVPALCAAILSAAGHAAGEPRNSDAAALAHIFGEDAQANVLELREMTVRLAAAERYALLMRHVLPTGRHEIAIAIEFAPASPADSATRRLGLLEESGLMPLEVSDDGKKSPRTLLAPAVDLVETARQTGNLQELRREVLARNSNFPDQQKSRAALLALIEIADGRFDEAQSEILKLFELAKQQPVEVAERPAEAVVMWTGIHFRQTVEVTRDLIFLVYEQARVGNAPRSERWHRHVYALKYLFDWRGETNQLDDPFLQPRRALTRWQPVSRRTAETCGKGFPLARWETRPGRVQHVTNHSHDYLYFTSPLAGEFSIEATLSTFSYHEIQLAADGFWAGPGYDLKSCMNGGFRQQEPDLPIVPPLTRVHDDMRARVVVKDGLRTTYINGRKVFETPHTPLSDPWIGLHCLWFTKGIARDLRISGAPTIPGEIQLARTPELTGWLPYYDESAGSPDSDWRVSVEDDGAVLIGRVRPDMQGAFQESLLRYHRPMWEDGAIEYEFYVEAGQYGVHPALGRLCFILSPDGVGRHELTDGRFDRTGADPAKFTQNSTSDPGAGQLPLLQSAWNRMRIDLKQDQVTLTLNGQLVDTYELDPDNDRTIGLFHYADQTEARVRNIRWRGDWPKELPALPDQELVDFTVDRVIGETENLPLVLEHNFSEGLPAEKFLISGEHWNDHIEQLDGGVRFTRPGGKYARDTISLPLSLEGDFDIVLEFEDFHSSIVEGGEANLQLAIYFDDLESTECRVYRKRTAFSNGREEHIVQSGCVRQRQGNLEMLFPSSPAEESTSGRLRMIRRGDQLYYLFACTDSQNYRLLHQRQVPESPTSFAGIKAVVECHKDGFASAVWKRLTVRAAAAPGAFDRPPLSLAELNRQRDELRATRFDQFTERVPFELFNVWGDPANINRQPDGWLISQPGHDQWQAGGISSKFSIEGDFDITLDFDAIKLEAAARNSESTIFLHVGFASSRQRAIELKFSISPSDVREVEMQLNTRHRNGSMRYEELRRVPANTVTQLRVARREETAYLLFQTAAGREPTILGRIEVGPDSVPVGSVWALVHTGGAGHETIAKFRRLSVAADKLIHPESPK